MKANIVVHRSGVLIVYVCLFVDTNFLLYTPPSCLLATVLKRTAGHISMENFTVNIGVCVCRCVCMRSPHYRLHNRFKTKVNFKKIALLLVLHIIQIHNITIPLVSQLKIIKRRVSGFKATTVSWCLFCFYRRQTIFETSLACTVFVPRVLYFRYHYIQYIQSLTLTVSYNNCNHGVSGIR